MFFPKSRVQNGPSYPRDRPAAAPRVQISPSCPRDRPDVASRVQNGPLCPRERFTGALPADCQQRAGLRSLRSLRPLPTSTASALRGDLYPSGPSPCPCPGVDTPARRRIPPAPAHPVCKTALSAPGLASCGLPCAKSPFLPPGPDCCDLSCAKQASLPTGPARHGLPCAKRPSMPPGILATLGNNRHICFN